MGLRYDRRHGPNFTYLVGGPAPGMGNSPSLGVDGSTEVARNMPAYMKYINLPLQVPNPWVDEYL